MSSTPKIKKTKFFISRHIVDKYRRWRWSKDHFAKIYLKAVNPFIGNLPREFRKLAKNSVKNPESPQLLKLGHMLFSKYYKFDSGRPVLKKAALKKEAEQTGLNIAKFFNEILSTHPDPTKGLSVVNALRPEIELGGELHGHLILLLGGKNVANILSGYLRRLRTLEMNNKATDQTREISCETADQISNLTNFELSKQAATVAKQTVESYQADANRRLMDKPAFFDHLKINPEKR